MSTPDEKQERSRQFKQLIKENLDPAEFQRLIQVQTEFKDGQRTKESFSEVFSAYLRVAKERKEEKQRFMSQQQPNNGQGMPSFGGSHQQYATSQAQHHQQLQQQQQHLQQQQQQLQQQHLLQQHLLQQQQQQSMQPSTVQQQPSSHSRREAAKNLIKQETDPDKIPIQHRKNALDALKKMDRDRKREMLKVYPWLGNYLKQIKMENMKKKRRRLDVEGTSTSEGAGDAAQKSTTETLTAEQQLEQLPLLAEAPLRNKLNLMVEQRGYSGCTPEVLNKLTKIVTDKMNQILVDLKTVSMYRNEEAYGKYLTKDYQRQESNSGAYTLVSHFHEQNANASRALISTDELASPVTNRAKSSNLISLDEQTETQALSGLSGIVSRRKRSSTLLKSLQESMPIVTRVEKGIKQYSASRKRVRAPEGNAEFPPFTITPVDCEQLFRSDNFFRNSKTLESLYVEHLSKGGNARDHQQQQR
eukprot:CAMPEP_0117441482 /NCGR_PEP_ID=MMETSP0759-20121206/3658_1 /TAXON_ID=63605 /ORGANISM="Percolomonas cosmopolitus, Strain WS" /LENGTH=472 /DNA_ID=CAMNT_0005233339 /DNA_START=197 /DNA_END=1615 /DNA_ORIENTATION=+